MANDLTGDYDVVAAFSLGAVDRILAAMHRGNRLPHSLSMAVDDLPTSRLGAAAVSVVDKIGNAITDVSRVKKVAYAVPAAAATLSQEALANVDPVVNWRPDPSAPREIQLGNIPDQPGGIVGLGSQTDYSYLNGVAQLQLGPPTMQLPRGVTNRADIHTPVMIRYGPEPHTLPLTDFMRGDIVTTFGVKEVPSPKGMIVVVDVTGNEGNVHFNPAWSANSLDPNDRAAINKALVKSLRSSFQPSTTPMPAGLKAMHFKGFPTAGPVCVLMNTDTSNNPSPASVNNIFIRGDDHFALAVNGDLIAGPLASAVNGTIRPIPPRDTPISITVDYWVGSYTYTFHIYTYVNVRPATVQMGHDPILDPSGNGIIVLTIPVDVSFGWKDKPFFVPDPVNFSMNIIQAFTLTLNGREVGLQRLSNDPAVVFIPDSTPNDEKNQARTQAISLFNDAWKSQQTAIQTRINQALSADRLQNFLKSMMNPDMATTSKTNPPQEVDPTLFYTSFEIRESGIILHGALSVPPWPAAHVEFDKDPWEHFFGPEYRALNSWIPGGTITEYQWNYVGATMVKDANRFVTVNAPALMKSSNRICLTFSGTRITASGPVFYQNVDSPRTCKWTSFPLGWLVSHGIDWSAGNRPHVIVPQIGPTPEGPIQVAGHMAPWAPEDQSWNTANFVVHFPDSASAAQLDFLVRALELSERHDTVAAILCVLTPQQLTSIRPMVALMYADDHAAWERLLDVRHRPATVVVNPAGQVVWRQEGEISSFDLAQVLRDHLAPAGQFFPQFIEPPLHIGEMTPNFLFDTQPGDHLTLRKLAGRPAALVFWRSSSAASMATIGVLHRAFARPGIDAPVVIAINDGEDGEFARGLAAVEEGEVIVVADPQRQISRAYGITMWPTIVFLDAAGLVQDIHLGAIPAQNPQASVGSSQVPSNLTGKES